MNTRPFLLHALSLLHAGTGHAADVIDLPTARMKATGIPFVPGSSIKGVLRAARNTNGADTEKLLAVFGDPLVRADVGDEQAPDGCREGPRRRCIRDHRVFHGRSQRRNGDMGKVKIWFDEEGDFLEVSFTRRKGTFREVGPDIYERFDTNGRVIGFAVFNFLKRDRKGVEIPLELAQVVASR